MKTFEGRPGFVYRVRDEEGVLLYIGSSIDVQQRLRGHAVAAPWWIGELAVTYQQFSSIGEARENETYAILTEHPRWNVRPRCEDHPDGHASSTYQVAHKFPFRETPVFRMSPKHDLPFYRRPHPCPLKAHPPKQEGAIPGLPGLTARPGT